MNTIYLANKQTTQSACALSYRVSPPKKGHFDKKNNHKKFSKSVQFYLSKNNISLSFCYKNLNVIRCQLFVIQRLEMLVYVGNHFYRFYKICLHLH